MRIEGFDKINIFIIGVGGTGSHLVSFLSQLIGNDKKLRENSRICLIDGDMVEEKNLRNQKFLLKDVNKNKAEVLASRYSAIYDIDIFYNDQYINSEDDIEKMIEAKAGEPYKPSIIVSCVDNNACRRMISKAYGAHKGKIIYIDAGNSSGSEELTGQIVVGYKERDGVKLPSLTDMFPQVLDEEYDDKTSVSCGEEMTTNIQNIGANITSALNVFNVLNSIISNGEINTNLCVFNATDMTTTNVIAP